MKDDYWERDNPEKLKMLITADWSERNIKRHLKFLEIDDKPESAFEIGAGIGRLLKYLGDNMNKQIAGCDSSKAMIEESKRYLDEGIKLCNTIKWCDGTGRIDELDDVYDLVFEIITFQHIGNIEIILNYLDEAYRILKPDGWFKFQVLNRDLEKTGLWHYHDLTTLTDYMKNIGFRKVGMKTISRWALVKGQK